MRALPDSGSTALLRKRVEDTQRRYERLVQLLEAAQEKCSRTHRVPRAEAKNPGTSHQSSQ